VKRPLLITDCDEVLLHMVSHFADWLEVEHGIRFDLETGRFSDAMIVADTGEPLAMDQAWILLDAFFRGEMHRQTLVPGAVEALGRIGEQADIVILTNLGTEAHPWRVDQLASHGIRHDVICNSGGKGTPVKDLLLKRRPTNAVFVDDLPLHHASVAKHAPDVWRLHMIAEPRVASAIPKAEHAHVRIDDWPSATDWILDKLSEKP
jgi:ribonucleotide monophosphatase NagD (HAD superfamily)